MIIGSIVIGMIAQTDRFLTPLAKAEKALGKFGKSIGNYLAGPVGRIEVLVGNMGEAVAQAFDKIDKAGDMADRIGTTTASLQELTYVAKLTGTETEGLGDSLMKMNRNLVDAARGAGPAGDALKLLGLDANKLVEMDPADAFREIAKGIQSIQNPAEQTAAAVAIFGKTGGGLLNTLRASPELMDKLTKEFRDMGGAVTENQRQTVGTMMDAFDKLGAAAGGVANKVAVRLAPAITTAAEKVQEMLTAAAKDGGPLSHVIDTIQDVITDIIIDMHELTPLFRVAFRFAIGAMDAFMWSLKKLSKAAKIAADLIDMIQGNDDLVPIRPAGGFNVVAEAKKAGLIRDNAAKDRAEERKKKLAGPTDEEKKARESADKMIKDLQVDVSMFGQSSDAIDLYKMKLAGATDQQIEQTRALKEQMKALKQAQAFTKAYADTAHSIWEEVQTPMEKYSKKLEDIHASLEGGAIDAATAGRAVAKARGEVMGPTKFAGALDAGSTEARSAILQAITGRGSKEDEIGKNTQSTAATLLRIESLQKQAAQATAKPDTELAMF